MAGMRDGHRNDCKSCNLAAKAARYRADPRSHIERVKQWQRDNRERYLARLRQWREEDPERKRRSDRESHLKRKFGITQAEYDRLLRQQRGGCAICGDTRPDGRTLHIDHDHRTGSVRGLLCLSCNQGLGQFKESPARLAMAIEYLKNPGPVLVERMGLTRMARERVASLGRNTPL